MSQNPGKILLTKFCVDHKSKTIEFQFDGNSSFYDYNHLPDILKIYLNHYTLGVLRSDHSAMKDRLKQYYKPVVSPLSLTHNNKSLFTKKMKNGKAST